MKNDLTCAVVRDLLPSYIEGLTSEETNQAVAGHLAVCPDCTAAHAAMAAPEAAAQEQAKEVDYLKTVKKKSSRRVLAAILATVLLLAAGIALELFIIGDPITSDGMSWSLQEDGGALNVRVFSTWSGVAYCRWDTETVDGVVTLSARKVLPSALYRTADYRTRIALDGVKDIWVADQLLWQDGVVILKGDDLYAVKTPYVGDMAALNKIANELAIWPHVGEYTNSLHTSSRPYRWTLDFSTDGWEGVWKKNRVEEDMPRYAAQLLALVENLDEVGWTWTDEEGIFHSSFITVEEVNALLPEWTSAYNETNGTDWKPLSSVKDYAGSPANIQKLSDICALY